MVVYAAVAYVMVVSLPSQQFVDGLQALCRIGRRRQRRSPARFLVPTKLLGAVICITHSCPSAAKAAAVTPVVAALMDTS